MEEKLTNEPMEANADTGANEKPCFDEILSDKDYQSEFDRRISKAIETAKAKWSSEQTNEDARAANERAERAEAELETYRLREKASKAGVPHDMLDYAVFAAQKLMGEETDFDSALGQLTTSQPWITAAALPTTGIAQSRAAEGKSGVERAFSRLNPQIKL